MFKLPNVPTSDDLIDKAFRQGSKVAKATRSTRAPRERRMKVSEHRRVALVGNIIESDLRSIIKNFPSYDQLSEFHKRLLEIKIDKDRYKKSLGAVQWCLKNIQQLKGDTLNELKFRKDTRPAQDFLGRAASMIKKIRKDLDELIEIKHILREFPAIEDVPTLVISGYPNVGKSTFMKNLTGSDVKIAPYPFTTQSIMIGHKTIKYQRYQIIDSPGLLDRPMEKRNVIELQAALAIKELADVILFMIDPNIDIEPQVSLLKEIREGFGLKIFVAVNKADITPEEEMVKAMQAVSDFPSFSISAQSKEDCASVFEKIFWEVKDAEEG